MTKYKLLLAEDNSDFSQMLSQYLSLSNFEVDIAFDGEEALQKIETKEFDLCLLDVMMPKMDGFSVAEQVKQHNPNLPFFFLTAKGLKEDRVRGLKIGADDYITKPFDPEELVLRIEGILRRTKPQHNQTISLASIRIDPNTMQLFCKEKSYSITKMEQQLFTIFLNNPNNIVERKQLLKTIWGDEDYFVGRSMDVFVSRFRKYIASDTSLNLRTIRGVGYVLEYN